MTKKKAGPKAIVSELDSLDNISFELESQSEEVDIEAESTSTALISDITKPITKESRHYINGKELLAEFMAYYEHKQKCLAEGKPIPPLTNKIGEAIIQIATRRCNSWKYVRYSDSWKEEMISNAIMLATIHGHNFNPEKSNNVFAYITTICDNAIKEQIKREKKELYIRYKQYENMGGYQAADVDGGAIGGADWDDGGSSFEGEDAGAAGQEMFDVGYEDRMRYIADFEERTFNKPKPQRKKSPEIVELDV